MVVVSCLTVIVKGKLILDAKFGPHVNLSPPCPASRTATWCSDRRQEKDTNGREFGQKSVAFVNLVHQCTEIKREIGPLAS